MPDVSALRIEICVKIPRGPFALLAEKLPARRDTPIAVVVKEDAKRAVDLFGRLERFMRQRNPAFIEIEELGERRCDDTPLDGIEYQPAGDKGKEIPLLIELAGVCVAEEFEIAVAGDVDAFFRDAEKKSGMQIVERETPCRMRAKELRKKSRIEPP